MTNSEETTEAQSIGVRVRKTMSELKGITEDATSSFCLKDLELLLIELEATAKSIRKEVQNKHNNGKISCSENVWKDGRVRKTMSDFKLLLPELELEDLESYSEELEVMIGGVRKEVQDMKNNG